MPTVHIHHPGATDPVARTLAPGDALLVGRSPTASRLTEPLEGWRLEAVALDHDAISANHALLRCDEAGVWVQDLASRNGTWLKLDTLPLALTSTTLRLDLAVVRPAVGEVAAPFPPPGWAGPQDYAACVCRAIRSWLEDQGFGAEVVPVAPREARRGYRLPLATGEEVELRPAGTGTFDLRFPRLMDAAAAFVETQNALLEQDADHEEGFVLRSSAFRAAHLRVRDAAQRALRLLLLGDTGTGKERLARCYHRHSPRHEGPFKAVNCALIERGLIYAQLFGARRGSFTGATQDLKGAVEAAHGGTLFLDEVADLDVEAQGMLLRFLDERGEYERLGDPASRRADVLLVCATSRDLRAAVRAGRFRSDLWYRFAGAVVDVPPLRDRPEDLRAFLELPWGAVNAWEALTPEARDLVLRHAWPGNFRELENFVRRLPRATRPNSIDRAACERALSEGLLHRPSAPSAPSAPPRAEPVGVLWGELLAQATRAWREDHEGADPAKPAEIRDFTESYLKPLLAANVTGVARGEPVKGLNWSSVARDLDVADGSTVKRWIERYVARFRGA